MENRVNSTNLLAYIHIITLAMCKFKSKSKFKTKGNTCGVHRK